MIVTIGESYCDGRELQNGVTSIFSQKILSYNAHACVCVCVYLHTLTENDFLS